LSGQDIIVSLDIGTSKVRAIIGEINSGQLNIVGVGSADSEGIRKGAIVDIDKTVESIRTAIGNAERMVGMEISEVYVGIAGNHIGLQTSHGVVAVANEDREIGQDDIDRVLQAAKVIALPPEREIIGIVPKQFLVDGLEGIQDPRGMIGVRLEVEAMIITGARTAIHNLIRCVERAGLSIAGLLLMSLAAGELALSKDEKMLGTCLVDIGAGATTIAVYDQGHLAATSTLPIGGDFITNDIAIGLRTHTDTAEKIKLKFGCAVLDDAGEDQVFKVTRIGSNTEKEYNQVDLAEIIEPRVTEIFQLIRDEVRRLGFQEIRGGFVLTGGTVSMPGVSSIGQYVLQAPVRVAMPDYIGVRDPSHTAGVGMIQYVAKHMRGRGSAYGKKSGTKKVSSEKGKPSWFEKVKNWFSEFI
jgi:cell division protein FtsA